VTVGGKGWVKERILMNEIEEYLFKNPHALTAFEEANRDIIQTLTARFNSFFEKEDVISKFLLATVLIEIVKVNCERQKDLVSKELKRRGITIMDEGGTKQ